MDEVKTDAGIEVEEFPNAVSFYSKDVFGKQFTRSYVCSGGSAKADAKVLFISALSAHNEACKRQLCKEVQRGGKRSIHKGV